MGVSGAEVAVVPGHKFDSMASMNCGWRIAKIRKLAGASPEDKRLIRGTFPELYRGAFTLSLTQK